MNRNWRVQHLSSNVRYMVGVNTQPCFAPIVKCFIQIWFFYDMTFLLFNFKQIYKVIIGKPHKKYKTRRSVEQCTPHAVGAWLNELGWSQ